MKIKAEIESWKRRDVSEFLTSLPCFIVTPGMNPITAFLKPEWAELMMPILPGKSQTKDPTRGRL